MNKKYMLLVISLFMGVSCYSANNQQPAENREIAPAAQLLAENPILLDEYVSILMQLLSVRDQDPRLHSDLMQKAEALMNQLNAANHGNEVENNLEH